MPKAAVYGASNVLDFRGKDVYYYSLGFRVATTQQIVKQNA
jgi:hypothetical protein